MKEGEFSHFEVNALRYTFVSLLFFYTTPVSYLLNHFEMKSILTFIALLAMLTNKAQTERVCGSDPTPEGWVTIAFGKPCSTVGNTTFYYRTIKKIANMDANSTIDICGAENVPKGWVTIRWNEACATVNGTTFHGRRIKKIEGLPEGTTLEICSSDPLPPGWVSVKIGGDCAQVDSLIYVRRIIKKL